MAVQRDRAHLAVESLGWSRFDVSVGCEVVVHQKFEIFVYVNQCLTYYSHSGERGEQRLKEGARRVEEDNRGESYHKGDESDTRKAADLQKAETSGTTDCTTIIRRRGFRGIERSFILGETIPQTKEFELFFLLCKCWTKQRSSDHSQNSNCKLSSHHVHCIFRGLNFARICSSPKKNTKKTLLALLSLLTHVLAGCTRMRIAALFVTSFGTDGSPFELALIGAD
jgi:hypothetical protein